MNHKYISLLTLLTLMACTTPPKVDKVIKTADGGYELTDAFHYCDLYINANHFSTIKKDSTGIILETDICNKCGRVFSEHETTGTHYPKEVPEKNWL